MSPTEFPTPETTSARATFLPAPAVADACGKAIVVGEHAVVYGARAVAMPVTTLRMQVKLMPRPGDGDPAIRLFLGGRPMPDHLREVVMDALALLGLPAGPMDLRGTSKVLIGAGLGSSASLCVALLRVLARSAGITLAPDRLAAFANTLERRFHGSPSGLDTAVVAEERLISFVRGRELAPIAMRVPRGRPWSFLLLDSGLRSSTKTMIELARPAFMGRSGEQMLARFDALASDVVSGFEAGDLFGVAEAIHAAGRLLLEIGVGNQEMQDLVDLACEQGALAAKITGAGGGGCVLALVAPERLSETRRALAARFGEDKVHEVTLC